MIFAGAALARRVEAAEAGIARGCATYERNAALHEAGGGIAVFQSADSPLTQAVGLGLNGPVQVAELDAVEAFFRSRGARVTIDLCPLADTGLVDMLAKRGYHATEFNNVLVRPLAGLEITLTSRVRRAMGAEADLWSHTVGYGFFERAELTDQEMDVGRAIFAMPGALCFLTASESGETSGGGAMAICGGLAMLFADSTVPRFRGRGLHRELIAARLHEAAALGCDLAAATTLPGSRSQRNYERMGFRVAYTKVVLADAGWTKGSVSE
jgi:GNAT superfamily N-acetyltransferase